MRLITFFIFLFFCNAISTSHQSFISSISIIWCIMDEFDIDIQMCFFSCVRGGEGELLHEAGRGSVGNYAKFVRHSTAA